VGGGEGSKGSLALKMEAVFFSKTLVSTYKSTLRYNTEDQHECVHPAIFNSMLAVAYMQLKSPCLNKVTKKGRKKGYLLQGTVESV
jgi:hypothetical protein